MAKTKTKAAWIERWDAIFTNMTNEELVVYRTKLAKCVETPTTKRKIKMIGAHMLSRQKIAKLLMPTTAVIGESLMKEPLKPGSPTGRMTVGYDPVANAQVQMYKLMTRGM